MTAVIYRQEDSPCSGGLTFLSSEEEEEEEEEEEGGSGDPFSPCLQRRENRRESKGGVREE